MQQAANMNDWLCNLQELECSDEMTMQIVDFVQNNDANKAAELLRRHKRVLLKELHNAENKVDLLDFLLYQLKKQKGKDDI